MTIGISISWVPVPVVEPGPVVSFRIKGESPGMAPHPVRLIFKDLNRIDDVIQRKVKFLVRPQRGECRKKSLPNLPSLEEHEDLPADVGVPGRGVAIQEEGDFELTPRTLVKNDRHYE